MLGRLRWSDMIMYESGDMLFKKVDLERVKNYEAIMMLLTKTKEDQVLRTVALFPSKMGMVGLLFMFQLNKVLMYMLMMHKQEDRPDRGGLPKPNPKYNPEVFDLSYVGVRKGSRKSIGRAGR